MAFQPSIDQLFEKFSRQTILIIGDVMIDSYLWGRVDRISPEAPVPIVALKKRENRLGGAANVALNIQSLGAKPVLCAVTGNDDKGKLFENLLMEQGMVCKGIMTTPSRPTTTKFRIIGNNAQMLRVDEETEQPLTETETQELFGRITGIVEEENPSCIVFEDYDKGVITPPLISLVVELAKRKNIPVVVDPKKKNFLQYKGVTLFKPNLKELKEGLKLDRELNNQQSVIAAIEQLQQMLNVDIAIATLSEKGISYSSRNPDGSFDQGNIPAHIRNIADVSGAGDTVISVMALCMAARVSVHDMAQLANLAGGMVCEYVGVVPINKEKLQHEARKLFNPLVVS